MVGSMSINEFEAKFPTDEACMDYLVHTANLDSLWSLLKRGIVGTFHNVSKGYLPLYLNEFPFRHNERDNGDIFGTVVRGC
jgi:hypothetical protein